MLLRKLRSASSTVVDRSRSYPFRFKENVTNNSNNLLKFSLSFLLFLFLWFLFLYFCFFPSNSTNPKAHPTVATVTHRQSVTTTVAKSPVSVCDGNVRVYIYDLPPRFNLGLLSDCRNLNIYTDMCPHVANRGLGQPLSQMGPNWFATHQFIAEMIFHARMENHPCRTTNPDGANLFYVPFYGGLHASSKFRETHLEERDRLAMDLVEHVSHQPAWQKHHGRDHFLALGRTAWDFMRNPNPNAPDFGANCLLNLPRVKNMSVLTVERHPWEGSNQHGIPYSSYFHPMSSQEMLTWQNEMRRNQRAYLFSFVGAPRKGLEKAAIRNEILRQCTESTRCKLLKCEPGEIKCHQPEEVMKVMRVSQFCMQAPGDSFTRRSTFDSVLAGCIPVFFSPHTAYTQYGWYLPADLTEYSVYIAEENAKQIEEVLTKIPNEKIKKMRKRVIELIPRITYAHPNATNLGFQDAVDVALKELSKHVQSKLVHKPS
ncbi:probable xyloglucan galactosyltransferase GT17 [Macadamia integrifolia]|uniref:probable xyloglucan galactosyltransferase GT17 n=1 Tax=Macadamia integrifolia TaxID=60698 RepID=UPI001C4F9441|nr:probable xyloglucan galactosyltransferase GT17 [Macadamia integrifolia]